MTELTAPQVLSDWESALIRQGTVVEIGRQTGTDPVTTFWVSARARVKGYVPNVLVETVQQGTVVCKVFFPDLVNGRFPLPVTPDDLLKVRGAEKQMSVVDNNTGCVGNVQIYVKITATG